MAVRCCHVHVLGLLFTWHRCVWCLRYGLLGNESDHVVQQKIDFCLNQVADFDSQSTSRSYGDFANMATYTGGGALHYELNNWVGG
jgi:hypothetical protein